MTMLTTEYAQNLPADPILACEKICTDFLALESEDQINQADDIYEYIVRMFDRDGVVFPRYKADNVREQEVHVLVREIRSARIFALSNFDRLGDATEVRLLDHSSVSAVKVKLSDDDRERATELLNDVRNRIRNSTEMTNDHKRRVFVQITRLQSEIDKVVSNYRVLLDSIEAAGETLGKFGKSSKPLVDNLEQILKIFERGKRLIGLSETSGLLAPPEQDEDE